MNQKREPEKAAKQGSRDKKPAKRENTVHARLPVEEIEKLDELARRNNIQRSAVIAIACARILKSGI